MGRLDVYIESKHGNIFQSKEHKWHWDKVPWVAGKHFSAPTCAVCHACHGSSWVRGNMDHLSGTLVETDKMVEASTELMQTLWAAGKADPANPFDEEIERVWVQQWLFYANSIRYAAAMGGPDYAAFKNGWWQLTKGLEKLEDALGEQPATKTE